MYIAFSPFPGLHGVMLLAAAYLFKLHLPTVIMIGSLNNPWTMIPFYSFDYAVGYWIMHSLLGFSPTTTVNLSQWALHIPGIGHALSNIVGSGSLCLWSFFVGGNLVGITAALVCSLCVRRFFISSQPLASSHEAHHNQ